MRISDWSSDVCSSDLRVLGEAIWIDVGGDDAGALRGVEDRCRQRVLGAGLGVGREAEHVVVGQASGEGHDVGELRPTLGDRAGLVERHRGDTAHLLEVLTALDEDRSEEHTSELQSLMRISYAVFCLKKK